MIIQLNGKFVSEAKAKISVFDHGFLYGDGVFERLRTYHGKIWNLKAHVTRLFHSAKLIKIHIPWSLEQVMRWIERAVKKGNFQEANIRVTLTRGMTDKEMRYDFVTPRKPTLVIMVFPFKPWLATFYSKGIKLITVRKEREFPEIKTTSLLPQVIANHAMQKAKADEALFISHDGRITEGTSCNIWFVEKGRLVMPDARVLPGTTVEIVKRLAKRADIPVVKKVVKHFAHMREMFVTSVTRGIMPVASLDGKKFQKTPGPMTQKLMELFREYVEQKSR